jgi:hypothetical protein
MYCKCHALPAPSSAASVSLYCSQCCACCTFWDQQAYVERRGASDEVSRGEAAVLQASMMLASRKRTSKATLAAAARPHWEVPRMALSGAASAAVLSAPETNPTRSQSPACRTGF